ncbi:MAG: HAMP domain-containing sensor histidine kinase [Pseudomonadota bacterium]
MALDTDLTKSEPQPPSLRQTWDDIRHRRSGGAVFRAALSRLTPRGLMIKIVGINIIPLLLFVSTFQFLHQYRTNLIEGELLLLEAQSKGISTMIDATLSTRQVTPPSLSAALQKVLPPQEGLHIAVADRGGILLFDSRTVWPAGPVLSEGDARDSTFLDRFVAHWSPIAFRLPRYNGLLSSLTPGDGDFTATLTGQAHLIAMTRDGSNLIIRAVMPLRLNGLPVGVVQVTKADDRLSTIAERMYFSSLRLMMVALFLTIVLSLFLTGFIVHPLRRLSRAAENVHRYRDPEQIGEMQALSRRKDEIGDLAEAFELMTKSLMARLQLTEQFAADVAHELKNPLTSLRSAFETYDLVKNGKKRAALRDIIAHDMNRLDRLITDIAKSSRLDAEMARIELVRLTLTPFLTRICGAYLAIQGEGKALGDADAPIIVTSGTPPRLAILAHGDRLSQVILNILDNALSFTPTGVPVTLATATNGASVRIMIDDCGPGIPENKIETIFDRFYSERPATEAFGQHSGLGLAIARQIVAAHRGRIWAENRKNKSGRVIGARFVIELPLLTPRA